VNSLAIVPIVIIAAFIALLWSFPLIVVFQQLHSVPRPLGPLVGRTQNT